MTATQLAFIDHRLRGPHTPTWWHGSHLDGRLLLAAASRYRTYLPLCITHTSQTLRKMAGGRAAVQELSPHRVDTADESCSCTTQKDLVDNFRTRTNPIHQDDLAKLKVLTQRDIEDDPTWLDAVIVTPGNDVRYAINRDQAVRL